MAGFFLSGVTYERMGAGAMFALSALFALIGCMIFSGFIWFVKNRSVADFSN
jgi:hypothetical protein